MEKTYIIILATEPILIDRDELIKYLKEKSVINDWEYCLPYSVFIKSEYSARHLSNLITEKYGKINHLITEVTLENYWGRLPKDYWDIFN